MFKKGDKYIHFTKYGSVNKGEVQSCGSTTSIDTQNLCSYKKLHIITTKGIILNLDGSDGKIYKIDGEFTIEGAKRINDMLTKAMEEKINEHIR
jgi:hypothetical protein